MSDRLSPSNRPPVAGTLFDAAAGQSPTLTVPELSAQIARLTAQAFPADLWVSGQIRNLSRSANGHVYFDLVEPTTAGASPSSLIAVTLLSAERVMVNNQIKRAGGAVRMEDGIEVRIQARLRWYEPRGTLQLRMHGIDPEFTIGRLKADRDRILAGLQADGLLDANAKLALTPVPLRVALITSAGSAAHADVMSELDHSGIAFSIRLFDVRTQGSGAVDQVVRALTRVTHDPSGPVDVVLLVRGGGATTDLAVFDNDSIARAIATMGVPVFTGIGHEIDRAVADEVAHTAHKTPTAAAHALVQQVRGFLQRLDSAWLGITRAALATAGQATDRLQGRTQRVETAVNRAMVSESQQLRRRTERVGRAGQRAVLSQQHHVQGLVTQLTLRAQRSTMQAAQRLDSLAAQARAHDPVLAMARGWTITTDTDGRSVRSVADLAVGTVLSTHFADGTATSTVTETRPTTNTESEAARPVGPAIDQPDIQENPHD